MAECSRRYYIQRRETRFSLSRYSSIADSPLIRRAPQTKSSLRQLLECLTKLPFFESPFLDESSLSLLANRSPSMSSSLLPTSQQSISTSSPFTLDGSSSPLERPPQRVTAVSLTRILSSKVPLKLTLNGSICSSFLRSRSQDARHAHSRHDRCSSRSEATLHRCWRRYRDWTCDLLHLEPSHRLFPSRWSV